MCFCDICHVAQVTPTPEFNQLFLREKSWVTQFTMLHPHINQQINPQMQLCVTCTQAHEPTSPTLYVYHPFTQWRLFHFLSLLFLGNCICVQNNQLHGAVLVRGNAWPAATQKKSQFSPDSELGTVQKRGPAMELLLPEDFAAGTQVSVWQKEHHLHLWPFWKETTKSSLICCDSQVTTSVLTVELLVSTLKKSQEFWGFNLTNFCRFLPQILFGWT